MGKYRSLGTWINRVFRNDLNSNFDDVDQDIKYIQTQLDQVVIEGDSSVEAAQARVNKSGTVYATLKERLDDENENITSSLAEMSSEKADKTEVNSLATSKAEKSYVDTNLTALDTKINSQASGSPKGVYATLSALQTAFPTGNTNTYVVAADGYSYYWNGSIWNQLTQYQSTGLANKSVTPEKATFFSAETKNIYSGDMYISQLFLDYSSAESRTTTGISTGVASVVIPLEVGVTYLIKKSSALRFRVAVFDQSPTAAGINAVTTLTNEIIAPSVTEVTYTAQSSGLYIVVYSSNNGTFYPIDILVDSYTLSTDISVDEASIKPRSISVEKTDFLVNAIDLLDGTYVNRYIDTTTNKIADNATTRSVIASILPNVEYTIKTFGTHNRFVVGLTNSLLTDTVISTFPVKKTTTAGNEEITFTNSGGFSYCMIYISNASHQPEITMTKGAYPVQPNEQLYTLNGKKIVMENDLTVSVDDISKTIKKYNGHYWEPEMQPDALGGVNSFANVAWTSEQFINNVYEPLRAKYPYYITRENIGKDASGLYDMWMYIFEPKFYTQTAFLQAGAHAWEEEGYLGLGRFMQILCEEHETHRDLSYLRWNVRFVVIPLINVWGVSAQTEGQRTSNNINGVNLNRDTVNKSQQETLNVIAQIDRFADDISYFLDFHTTGRQTTWGDYMYEYYNAAPNARVSLRTIHYLSDKNIREGMNREPD
ncbi:MAG: hypothetical protein K0S25_1, partial [Bacillus sp. (in: firmicutes)]|nr:hypothetical protein [Bacillus sp. (in: firmicutes)]